MASNSRMRTATSVYYSCPWPTTGVIWLCACVKYWPYFGVGTCASVLKSVLTIRHLHISHNASCLPLPPSPSFPKFCMSIVFDFSWDGYKTQEKWKTKVMQNFGGCIMGNVEVAYDVVGVWEASGTKLVPRVEPWGRGCQRHIPRKIKPREHPKAQTSKAHPVWR